MRGLVRRVVEWTLRTFATLLERLASVGFVYSGVVLAAQTLMALLPLLIVVVALLPNWAGTSLAQTLRARLGVSGETDQAVGHLIASRPQPAGPQRHQRHRGDRLGDQLHPGAAAGVRAVLGAAPARAAGQRRGDWSGWSRSRPTSARLGLALHYAGGGVPAVVVAGGADRGGRDRPVVVDPVRAAAGPGPAALAAAVRGADRGGDARAGAGRRRSSCPEPCAATSASSAPSEWSSPSSPGWSCCPARSSPRRSSGRSRPRPPARSGRWPGAAPIPRGGAGHAPVGLLTSVTGRG